MSHTISRRPVLKVRPEVEREPVGSTAPQGSVGDDYKLDLRQAANDRLNRVELKWMVNNQAHLPKGIRIVDRASDREVDLKHQLDGLKQGLDETLLEVGRKRDGRVDSGEKLIDANTVSFSVACFAEFIHNGFDLVDIHAYRKPPQGKFGKEKFVMVMIFARADSERQTFAASQSFMDQVEALVATTFQFLHVWGNPDGSVTFNFLTRVPGPLSDRLVDIQHGRLGVYLR